MSRMDVNEMLIELKHERDNVGEAIVALERLQLGRRRRGRTPSWIVREAIASTEKDVKSKPKRQHRRKAKPNLPEAVTPEAQVN